jgi:glycosyltransferase involved in cell wall biosynthesis
VLLVAYACGPHHGSEPGAGWRRALQTARYCDTWVICEEHEFDGVIRQHERASGLPAGLQFVFVPKHRWQQRLGRLPGLYYASYNLWHRQAANVAERLHREVRFDLVHQVNMCGFREPGYAWRLDAPFVWGPIGGTQNFPWRFASIAGPRGTLQETARSLLNRLQLHYSPRVRRAARRAAVLFAANSTNQRDLARALGVAPQVQCDVGLDRLIDADRDDRRQGPLRILWCGNLLPFKGLPVLLHALAALPSGLDYRVRVVGEGPCHRRWRRLADKLRIGGRVEFLGRLPHGQALSQYQWADLFAFTSLRDTTGTVVMEALAAGLPILCLDHQGVGDVVTPECGIKVPPRNPTLAVSQFAAALEQLATDRQLLAQLAQGARCRAQDFLWSRLGDEMIAAYRSVLGDEFEWTPRDESSSPALVSAAANAWEAAR